MSNNSVSPSSKITPTPFDQSDCDYSEMLRFERRWGKIWGGWTLLQLRRVLTLNLVILVSSLVVFFVILHASGYIAGAYIVGGLVYGTYRSLKQVKEIDIKKNDRSQKEYLKDRKTAKRGGPWMGNQRTQNRPRTYQYELCVQSMSVRPWRRRSKGVTR